MVNLMKKLLSAALAGAMLLCMAPAAIADETVGELKPHALSYLTVDYEKGIIDGIDGSITISKLENEFEGDITVKSPDGKTKSGSDAVCTDDVVSSGNDSAKAVIYGDLNRDGRVSVGDAVDSLKKVAGWDIEVNEYAADVDRSGSVNVSDAILILKKVAGWDGISLGRVRMIAENDRLVAENDDPDLDLCFETPMIRVGRSSIAPTNNFVYEMKLARNETESCQAVLSTVADKEVTPELSAFRHEKFDYELESEVLGSYYYNLNVFYDLVADSSFKKNANGVAYAYNYDGHHVGDYYADPLPKITGPVELKAGTSKIFMINVTSQKDAPAGMYRATLNFKDNDGNIVKSAYVYAYVWDFTLPDGTYSVTDFGMMAPYTISKDFKNESYLTKPELYVRYYEMMLDYNITSTVMPYEITDDRADAYMNDPRVTSFLFDGPGNINVGGHSDAENLAAYNKIKDNELWLSKAYIHEVDEPYGENGAANIRAQYAKYSQMLGRDAVKIMIPLAGNNSYFETSTKLDIWEITLQNTNIFCPQSLAFLPQKESPLTNPSFTSSRAFSVFGENLDRIDSLREAGTHDLWWYVCVQPQLPWANFFVNYHGIANRVLLWQQFMYNVDGLLYWNVSAWSQTDGTVSRFETLSDGVLIYYSELFGYDAEPVPSYRLVQVRDGLDDFDYLSIAEELCGRDAVNKVLSTVTTGMLKYTEDPEVMEAAREALAEMIIAAQSEIR